MAGLEGLLHGRLLGDRYRVEEVIGRGGMGAVYRARDERLGREVAAKVITLAAPDGEARDRLRARFRHEAASAARLPHHPNVVPVYDYGTDEALGLDYLVMELLRGDDLATRLATGELPPLPMALSILREAAAGVAVGHRAGLIHRDVKPGNIFLVRQGGDEVQVRVLDFGIAKVAEEEDSLGLTQEGAPPHSPRYASPEQLRGSHRLTPASDVFSLGAVGYQLLSGSRPYDEEERNRLALGMEATPRPLRALSPAVPSAVEAVIHRCLAVDPAQRPADADVLLRELDAALRGLGDETLPPYAGGAVPVSTHPERSPTGPDDDRTLLRPEPDDRTLLDPRAGRPAAATPPPRRPPPPTPRPRPRYEERSGSGIWVATLTVLLLLGAAGVVGWWWLYERQGLPATELEIPEAPPELPPIDVDTELEPEPQPTRMDAFIANQEGMRLYRNEDFEGALEQFRRAVLIDPDDPAYRNNLARTLHQLGMYAEAEDELVRVTRMDPARAVAYANLADTRLARADTAGAIAALERFLEVNNEPRQQGIQERRLRDLRAAQLQPRAPPVQPAPEPAAPAPAPPDTLPAG
jgi:serine/threonine protein kinase